MNDGTKNQNTGANKVPHEENDGGRQYHQQQQKETTLGNMMTMESAPRPRHPLPPPTNNALLDLTGTNTETPIVSTSGIPRRRSFVSFSKSTRMEEDFIAGTGPEEEAPLDDVSANKEIAVVTPNGSPPSPSKTLTKKNDVKNEEHRGRSPISNGAHGQRGRSSVSNGSSAKRRRRSSRRRSRNSRRDSTSAFGSKTKDQSSSGYRDTYSRQRRRSVSASTGRHKSRTSSFGTSMRSLMFGGTGGASVGSSTNKSMRKLFDKFANPEINIQKWKSKEHLKKSSQGLKDIPQQDELSMYGDCMSQLGDLKGVTTVGAGGGKRGAVFPGGNIPHEALECPPWYFVLKQWPWLLENIQKLYTIRWNMTYPLQRRLPLKGKFAERYGLTMTYGEFILIIPFFVMFVVNLLYSFWRPDVAVTGQLARLPLMLALASGTHNSIITLLLGMPFERILFYHKLSGRLAFVNGFFHTYVAFFYPFAGSHRNPAIIYLTYPVGGTDTNLWYYLWDGGINASGTLILSLILGILITSLPYVRQTIFELFFYVHILFALTMVGCAFYHSGALVVILACVLYGGDLLMRKIVMSLILYPRKAFIKLLTPEVVELAFPKKGSHIDYNPGQYFYLAIPQLSIFEWHPFSISSSPHQPFVTFHIRIRGNWTTRLGELAKIGCPDGTVDLLLEGPYGSLGVDLFNNPTRYKSIMLLSGGIGVTPMQSICHQLMFEHETSGRALSKVWFMWTARDPDILDNMDISNSSRSSVESITSQDMLEASDRRASSVASYYNQNENFQDDIEMARSMKQLMMTTTTPTTAKTDQEDPEEIKNLTFLTPPKEDEFDYAKEFDYPGSHNVGFENNNNRSDHNKFGKAGAYQNNSAVTTSFGADNDEFFEASEFNIPPPTTAAAGSTAAAPRSFFSEVANKALSLPPRFWTSVFFTSTSVDDKGNDNVDELNTTRRARAGSDENLLMAEASRLHVTMDMEPIGTDDETNQAKTNKTVIEITGINNLLSSSPTRKTHTFIDPFAYDDSPDRTSRKTIKEVNAYDDLALMEAKASKKVKDTLRAKSTPALNRSLNRSLTSTSIQSQQSQLVIVFDEFNHNGEEDKKDEPSSNDDDEDNISRLVIDMNDEEDDGEDDDIDEDDFNDPRDQPPVKMMTIRRSMDMLTNFPTPAGGQHGAANTTGNVNPNDDHGEAAAAGVVDMNNVVVGTVASNVPTTTNDIMSVASSLSGDDDDVGEDDENDVLHLEFFLTSKKAKRTKDINPFVSNGRPDIKAAFRIMKQDAIKRKESRVAVCVCAPQTLVDICHEACVRYSDDQVRFDFHSEIFG